MIDFRYEGTLCDGTRYVMQNPVKDYHVPDADSDEFQSDEIHITTIPTGRAMSAGRNRNKRVLAEIASGLMMGNFGGTIYDAVGCLKVPDLNERFERIYAWVYKGVYPAGYNL